MTEKIELPYNESDSLSIEKYSQSLLGKTFKNVLEISRHINSSDLEDIKKDFNNPRKKGSLGNLIEKYFFYYSPNSNSKADFPKAGVELKVTPFEQRKNRELRAGERLVLSMIPNDREVEDKLEKSHLMEKIKLILIIFYLRDKKVDRIDYKIKYSKLFSILSKECEVDFKIIKSDYKKIIKKIKDGEAHNLSERDTIYLGACTKGSTAKESLRTQYYNSNFLTKSRAFCFKQSYMTHVLNKYILKNINKNDSIFKKEDMDEEFDFDKNINKKLEKYCNKSETELLKKYKINKKAKNKFNLLACRMLGIKSNDAEEFVKADVVIKAIRLEENGRIKEHMSFPNFKIKEYISNNWEDSCVYDYFSNKRFLFLIFSKIKGEYYFSKSLFWNIPECDLENKVKKEWENSQNVFKEGIKLFPKKTKTGWKVENNLPNPSEDKKNIFFVKPHLSKTAYLINGIKYGKGNLNEHTDELPNGDLMTKPSMWLNKNYILKAIEYRFQIKDYISNNIEKN